MLRKISAKNVAAVALATGFATALATPAGAVVCTPANTDAVNFETDDISCTIDFVDLDDDGTPNSLLLGFWAEYGVGGRGQAAQGNNLQYRYNVFGTPVPVVGGRAGSTSASADLIVLSATDGQRLNGTLINVGFGIGVDGNTISAEGLINSGNRLEFRFQDPTGGRNDEDGGFDFYEGREITLQNIQIVSYRVGETFAIEAFDAEGNQSGETVNLVTTAGRAADDATEATTADAAVATYEVGLAGVRFQIVGTQLAVPDSAGGPDGEAGNGLFGIRVRGASFGYADVVPLPGALISALTGLTVIGGLAARRRRRLRQSEA